MKMLLSSAMGALSRRGLVTGAGLAAAGFALPSNSAEAAGKPRGQAGKPALWGAEYWATKGDIGLYMYRKRLGAPRAGEVPRPVLFLVHGSSVSSRSTYDLTVPGHGEYNFMNVFANMGFDCWTMDHEGYGRSTRGPGNSDIASGVLDLQAAAEVVARETGQRKYHMYGESSGALRVGAFATANPDRVGRLVLLALTYTGEGSPTLGKRAEAVEFYRTHNRRPRDRDMIRSIFTRDKEGTSEPAVAEAMADAEMPFGDSVPTGTYLDMTANLPVIDPAKILAPTLVVRGEYDGIATVDDLLNFYRKLPNADRQFAIIPNAAHSVALGTNRHALWHVMQEFLTLPQAS